MGRGYKAEDKPPVSMGTVTMVRATNAAVQVRLEDNDTEWIPISQIDESSEITADSVEDDDGELIISGWLAGKKGID